MKRIGAGIMTTLLLLAAWSCKSAEYTPATTVRVDTTYINRTQRDSIYRLDSVHILDRGDTILISRVKYIYKDRIVHDTIYESRTDSVVVPYIVERKLTKWEQLRMGAGDVAAIAVIIIILVAVGRCMRT